MTGLAINVTCPDFEPERLAVAVMVPPESVGRTVTRWIPHSVFRQRLLVESTLQLRIDPQITQMTQMAAIPPSGPFAESV